MPVTLAWFKAEQRDLGTFDTIIDNQWTYRGEDVASDGFELEFAGTIGGHTQLSLGLTTLELEDPAGDDIYLWVPRDTATLSISHQPPALPELRLGLNARWQSEIGKLDDYTQLLVRQGGYGLLGAFVSWEFPSGIELAVNAGNLTDKKYIGSLYEVGYYGAPRTLTAELSYRF